ncbi:two-component sensor histidine kinase [Desulfuromonas versatilis]|uniref:histidine kinase n=1 Tax=Desulfuromonas versatilis TaxID=2802975 RepID=A0ABM8HUX4_9BACT|nr:HAMP domain-containing sensor histidine kinase [Desulfuromonas versatilis]BCR06106.1 two-component sensor histidine kinase [Desulfuromonas versatilis]
MKLFKRLINPLMAFIGIQLVWIVVVVLWIYWFMGKHRQLRSLAEKYSPELLQGNADWFILAEGLLLLLAILAGIYVIFLYWQRQAALYRAQRHFIAQVTHELKSPLASLQLHLETIRRRRPSPEKMDVFVDTMLGDTDRLQQLISNLLTANRVEQRKVKLALRRTNLSELVNAYFKRHQYSLPKAGKMTLAVEPDLFARIEAESLETVFRNLLENAILYSVDAPRIRVELARKGRQAHLAFTDNGRGIERRELKKVFQMFYRVRQTRSAVRGSGLGLFIVKAIVKLHRGKVWLESPGEGRGATVHILLPLDSGEGKEEQ